MYFKRLLHAFALCFVIFLYCKASLAASVASWDLGDFDNDGIRSRVTVASTTGSFGTFGETGCSNAPDGMDCIPISLNTGPITRGVFAAGFMDPASGEVPEPFIPSNIAANIGGGVSCSGRLEKARVILQERVPVAFGYAGEHGAIINRFAGEPTPAG